MYKLKMNKKLAKLKFFPNNFEVIEIGDHVVCAVSGKEILLENLKKGNSIALMIDQRVSEGEKSNFFGKDAFTTTIPAQLVKKFGCKIVPIHIERYNDFYFKMKVEEPINYNKDSTIDEITLSLNKLLEKMILKNPSQWIWSHNRWK